MSDLVSKLKLHTTAAAYFIPAVFALEQIRVIHSNGASRQYVKGASYQGNIGSQGYRCGEGEDLRDEE